MKKTTASESNLAVCNYALGYADRLVAPHLRRNQPTEERYWDDFRRGLSDAERRRPFDPPGTQANDARRGGERIGAPWRTTGRTVANNREGDGKVWTCGWAQYGRLGLSDAESAAAGGGLLYGKYLAVPKQVGGISGVAAIGGGRPQRRCRGDGTVGVGPQHMRPVVRRDLDEPAGHRLHARANRVRAVGATVLKPDGDSLDSWSPVSLRREVSVMPRRRGQVLAGAGCGV